MTEPTDAEIIALADETRTAEGGASGYILPISFARAVLAKWGAQPVPAGYALVPVEPSAEMVDAAQEAYMPFGDMQLAIQLAIAAAPQPVVREPLTDSQAQAGAVPTEKGERHASQAAPVCGSPADLPPLPDPDLRDVGTKPEDIKNFLRGYATEYAKAALASSAPADSVLEDAARLDWLDEDAARAAQEGKSHGN